MRSTRLKLRPDWTLVLVAGLALACGSDPPAEEPAPEAATPAPTVEIAEEAALPLGPGDAEAGAYTYKTFCASCHGETGCGDGPLASTLDPKPARHCDGERMNGIEDEYLVEIITRGGYALDKSPMMAAWGGNLSPQEIQDVVAFIRTLADPPYADPGS